jgi:hypothetical protein
MPARTSEKPRVSAPPKTPKLPELPELPELPDLPSEVPSLFAAAASASFGFAADPLVGSPFIQPVRETLGGYQPAT